MPRFAPKIRRHRTISPRVIIHPIPIFVLFFILSISAPAFCQARAEGDSSSIVIHVVHDGRPVAGAEVYSDSTRIGQTDGDGAIQVSVLMFHGRIWSFFRIIARVPGRLSGFASIGKHSNPDSAVIRLFPARTVSGVVRDDRGKPIPGAKVVIWKFDGDGINRYMGIEIGESIPGVTAVTDSRGRFRLEGIPEPSYVCLKAIAVGYTGLDQQNIPAGTDNLTLCLEPESRITGRITYENGTPAQGFRVVGQAKLSTRSAAGYAHCFSDENGRYALEHLSAGMYIVKIEPDSTRKEWVSFPLVNVGVGRGKTTEHADIKLVRGIPVTGRVVEEKTGNPMPGAPVTAWQIISDEGQTNWWNQHVNLPGAWTDQNGEFRFQALPGKVEVNTYPIQGSPSFGWRRGGHSAQVIIEEGKPVEPVVVRFERGVDIHGTVRRPDGSPAPDVEFTDGYHSYAYSDERGAFILPGIIPGHTIPFKAFTPRGDLVGDFPVRADSLDTVEVVLHAPEFFSWEGIVVDGRGNPVSGIPVDMDYADGLVSTARPAAAVTGFDGRFTVDHIPGGRNYRFSVRDGLGVSESFHAENVKQPLRIVLPKADRWLEGTVRDEDGKPMAGMKVDVWAERGHVQATTGVNGRFRLEGLASQRVSPSFSGLRGYFSFQEVATNRRRDFTLPTGRHYLSGLVNGIRGKPLADASVEITRKEKSGWPVIIQTDTKGCFYFSELGRRVVILKVSCPGYREQTFRVRTDRENVRLRLVKAGRK